MINRMLERANLEISRAEVLLRSGIKNTETLKVFLNHLVSAIEHIIESEVDEQELYFDKHLVDSGYIDEDNFELYYHLKMLITMEFVITEEGFRAKTWKSSFIVDNELLEEYIKKVKQFMLDAADKKPLLDIQN